MKQFLRICFWFFLCFNVLELNNSFQAKNKTLGNGENVLNSLEESYSVSFLKLSQLLLAGDVESNPGPVNYTETPKGKGRPKKSNRVPNFGKPKILNDEISTAYPYETRGATSSGIGSGIALHIKHLNIGQWWHITVYRRE